VWQLQKFVFYVCPIGGSSRGLREFITNKLPQFQQQNPQITVEIQERKQHHPYVSAEYLHGRPLRDGTRPPQKVGLKNRTPDQIWKSVAYLRNSSGRKAKSFSKIKYTNVISVQGEWNGFLVFDPINLKGTKSTRESSHSSNSEVQNAQQ